ncbi:hypothetical protein BDP27DRAFT_1320762 [Rhodocollybia butyracea]|uniref:Uncharacterized protein n=1 Tax=Rhodocollybia butyracea TaxID=206335 RepID=A0A9P5Q041_9AGAR|nr:hypothetical protein BDP27DRAFT_1320762 [Rhodocollybia butyracea]
MVTFYSTWCQFSPSSLEIQLAGQPAFIATFFDTILNMRSVLFFTVIASSLLAVCPLPMDIWPSNQPRRLPQVPRPLGPIVTFINPITGKELGDNIIKAPAGIGFPLSKVIGKGITYKSLANIEVGKAGTGRTWLYFKVFDDVLGCNPCFGYMARGNRYILPSYRPADFDKWYIGISKGQPAHGSFKYYMGKPARPEYRDDRVMLAEWQRIFDEFESYFMAPKPEVIFVSFPMPLVHLELPFNPPETEDPTKELNRALNRDLGGEINYKGRYYKSHDYDAVWVYFLLTAGNKRCTTASPCYGCIVVPPSGTKHVLIVQRKPGQLSLNVARVDWIGAYYGPGGSDEILAFMEHQLGHRFMPRS